MRPRLSVLALLGVLGACGTGGPFVLQDATSAATVALTKQADQIRKLGYFTVCYDDGEEAEADALAAETCADYKLVALKSEARRYQCSLTEPHQVLYYCVDPKMRMADGHYINPMDATQVKYWQEQQERLRAAAARHGEPLPAAPAGAPAAPGAAELGAPPAPDLSR